VVIQVQLSGIQTLPSDTSQIVSYNYQ